MYLSKRDIIATSLVAIGAVAYALWAVGSALPGMSSARVTGMAVLALGFASSASAVVPAFDQLLHGSKTYLAIPSLIGLAALAAGIVVLVTASGASLAVLMATTALLWLIATIRHSLVARTGSPPQQVISPQSMRHGPRPPRTTPA
jgi:hypothetical protein